MAAKKAGDAARHDAVYGKDTARREEENHIHEAWKNVPAGAERPSVAIAGGGVDDTYRKEERWNRFMTISAF